MADCIDCGKRLGAFEYKNKGRCADCEIEANSGIRSQTETQKTEQDAIRVAEIDAIILTTETASNLNITKRIEIITAECAFGMNVFKDLFAGMRDVFGGRSEAIQKTMRDSRRTVLYELKREAHLVGANAVVGVDLDYVEMSSSGSMVLMVASGTAVVLEDE